MKRRDIIRRAGRSLRQAKIRTLLTALAISVGAFTITLSLAAGAGGQKYTQDLIANNGDMQSLMVFAGQDERQNSDAPTEYSTTQASRVFIKTSDVDNIKKIDGVGSVTPMYAVTATYIVGPSGTKFNTPVQVKADQTNVPLAAGSLEDNQPVSGSVIVSESFIEPLGFKSAQDAIGQKITLRIDKNSPDGQSESGKDVLLTIQAVDKKSDMLLNYNSGVQISVEDGKALYGYQNPQWSEQYYGVVVRVSEDAEVPEVQAAIKKLGYNVLSVHDVQQVLLTFVNVVMGGAAGFGVLAIIASIFGIINTQYISVLERTQQIGIMKALGMRRRDIAKLFRYEAAWVGFLGGIIGAGLALLTGSLLNPVITKQLNLEEGTRLLIFQPLPIIILVVSLVVIAVLAGYLPARKAARLDPIEALRTE